MTSLQARNIAQRVRTISVVIFSLLTFMPAALRAEGEGWIKASDNKTYGQALVTEIMQGHPALLTAGLHAVAPGKKVQSIVASTLDRIGKEDDEGDLLVGEKGATVLTPALSDPPRLGILLPLLDASGKRIGALALAYKYHGVAEEAKFYNESVAIRDAIAKKIPNLSILFKPAGTLP